MRRRRNDTDQINLEKNQKIVIWFCKISDLFTALLLHIYTSFDLNGFSSYDDLNGLFIK